MNLPVALEGELHVYSPHLLRASFHVACRFNPTSKGVAHGFTPLPQHAPLFGLLTILVLSGFSGTAFAANQAGSPAVAPRIVAAVDETKMVTLTGSTHRLALPQYDQGAVEDSMPMEHMLLQLRRSPEQEAGFGAYD